MIKNNFFNEDKKVCILGVGYVGLTLGVTLADFGVNVVGVETNKQIIVSLKKGIPHFYEEGLPSMLKQNINKNLIVTDKLKKNLSDIYIISVGTPLNKNKKPDLHYLKNVCFEVGNVMKKNDLIILRSTVPVTTCRNIVIPILEKVSNLKIDNKDFFLAFAPERTIEGKALKELRELPQIIGSYNKEGFNRASNLFSIISPMVINVGSLEAAEIIKIINNTFRDVKFAYSNELAMICDGLNLDTVSVIESANKGYPRDKIPVPSPGVGGTCLTKDSYLFLDIYKNIKIKPKMVELGRKINEDMPLFVVQKIVNYFKRINRPIKSSKIFIVGFGFKGEPETSDMRDSTTLIILKELQKHTKNICGFDPIIPKKEIESLGIKWCNVQEGFKNSDCVIIANNHTSYNKLDIYDLLASMNKPGLLFDCWHMFQSNEVRKIKDISYGGLGND